MEQPVDSRTVQRMKDKRVFKNLIEKKNFRLFYLFIKYMDIFLGYKSISLYFDNFTAFQTVIQELRIVCDDKNEYASR